MLAVPAAAAAQTAFWMESITKNVRRHPALLDYSFILYKTSQALQKKPSRNLYTLGTRKNLKSTAVAFLTHKIFNHVRRHHKMDFTLCTVCNLLSYYYVLRVIAF